MRSRRLRSTALAVGAALLVLVGAACASIGGAGAELGRADQPFTADVGCDARMDTAFEAWAARGVAASVVDLGGERTCVAAYGLADPTTGRPNTVDTVFSIGSITKSVTAVAVFDLIDRGVLTLDDRAGDHVPGLHNGPADATIRQLLLHTSGITGQHGVDHTPMSEPDAIDAISDLDISFEPGSAYQYANANYTLLALIIEHVTDVGYRRYLAERIMVDRTGHPIGGFWDGQPAAAGPRAWGHFAGGNVSSQRGEAPGPHWAMDGNGLVAMTALEMAEWTHALFTGRILSAEATDLLRSTSTRLAEEKELPGWAEIDRRLFGEPVLITSGGGGAIGHLMNVAWFPESSRVIVVAENAADHDVPSFTEDVVGALVVGTGIPLPPEIPPADEATLALATGRYRIGDEGQLVVTEVDGGLLVAPTGAEAMAALHPVPAAHEALIAEHERLAMDFVEGRTGEGRRERARLEADHGPLVSAEVAGTVFDAELVTYVVIELERATTVLGIALNRNGGSEALGYDSWPETWFVARPDGRFAPYLPYDGTGQGAATVLLRPTAEGMAIDIEGPEGEPMATRLATRLGTGAGTGLGDR